jgi:predicted HD phosphohydrolase
MGASVDPGLFTRPNERTKEAAMTARRPEPPPVAAYSRLEDCTKEDILSIAEANRGFYASTADRVLEHFAALRGEVGAPLGAREHCLQAATRALRDGADSETVVAALLHDIGESLAPHNHGEIAAAIIRPFVTASTHWMVKHHAIFQGAYYFHHLGRDRYERDRFRDHPAFIRTVEFCARWDQVSFDPNYDTLPIEAFEPFVREIFSREPWSLAPPAP